MCVCVCILKSEVVLSFPSKKIFPVSTKACKDPYWSEISISSNMVKAKETDVRIQRSMNECILQKDMQSRSKAHLSRQCALLFQVFSLTGVLLTFIFT